MPKLKKLRRHRPQIPVLLSTEINGILGLQPDSFYQLFQTLSADCCPLDGVEFLPFRLSYQRLCKTLQKMKIPILGMHAPVGWNHPGNSLPKKMFFFPFTQVTPSFTTTFKLTAKIKPNYLLFHENDLDICSLKRELHDFLQNNDPQLILLENIYRPDSLKKTLKKAKQLQSQTQAGVMIDLVHLLMEEMKIYSFFDNYQHHLNTKNINHYWELMLRSMGQILSKIHLAGLHIPLGGNRDSLPWELLEKKHWRELAQLIDRHQDRIKAITIENQHSETVLNLSKKRLPQLIKEKKMKLRTLFETGVL